MPVPETPRFVQVVPAAHSEPVLLLTAQGWPAPGRGWQVPRVPTFEPLKQKRSPAQPTTGVADRSQGCPWVAYTTVLPSVQIPVVGWQKLPSWQVPPAHVLPTGITFRQVEHRVPFPPQMPVWHWLE
jgi:hypothetical protein